MAQAQLDRLDGQDLGHERRTDIDLLRILICVSIIFAHALLIFAAEPRYHIKSEAPSMAASILYEFLRATTMAMFFVLAGWSAVTSLRGRSIIQFLQERVMRLLVPLVTGFLLFGSTIKYIELRHGRDIGLHGFRLVESLPIGFFDFYPRNLAHMKLVTWSHLWFLAYLFLISILLLPLLVRLSQIPPNASVPSAFTVYLPALPMVALLMAFNGYWPFLPNLVTDWANFCYFAMCFVIGAGLAAWPGFEIRLRLEVWRLVTLTLLAFAGLILAGESMAGRLFVGLTAWGAIGTALGLAARTMAKLTPGFVYLTEATLPVYIVHHAPLLLIAIVVLPLPVPIWLKIVVISFGSAAISMMVYHWLIRTWAPARLLMGLPPQISHPRQQPR